MKPLDATCAVCPQTWRENMKSAADINLLTAKQINAMTYRDLAPIGFNHLRDQALSALTLKDERDKLAAENERAFQMLECLGVPQERAKTVSNGIDVYATRMNRAAQDAEQKLSAIERAAGALPEEPEPDLDGLPWTHWASPEVVKYVKKLRLSATALAADAARWQYLRTRINYE